MIKRMRIAVAVLVLTLGFAAVAQADLDGFLRRVNEQAKADLSRFTVNLSAQFGVPVPDINVILRGVSAPADAFMVLQLGQMTNTRPESVLKTYQRNRGKGWGVIAKELGIKPGSPEFHALKRGDFAFTGQPSGSAQGHGKGKGHGHGHGRGDED